jgi:hypothetical protein
MIIKKVGVKTMKNKKILFGMLLIIFICFCISSVSAEDKIDAALNDDNPNNVVVSRDAFINNKHVKLYKTPVTYAEFNEKEVLKAKNGKSVTKILEDKCKVKKKVKIYKKVKVTKKFTCWNIKNKKLKMDKNYFKKYYKYQAKGYKIDKGKWIGNKVIFTATKKVKKFTGNYKTKWCKSSIKAKLTYNKHEKKFYITFYPSAYHKGAKYYKTYHGYVTIFSDV